MYIYRFLGSHCRSQSLATTPQEPFCQEVFPLGSDQSLCGFVQYYNKSDISYLKTSREDFQVQHTMTAGGIKNAFVSTAVVAIGVTSARSMCTVM